MTIDIKFDDTNDLFVMATVGCVRQQETAQR